MTTVGDCVSCSQPVSPEDLCSECLAENATWVLHNRCCDEGPQQDDARDVDPFEGWGPGR